MKGGRCPHLIYNAAVRRENVVSHPVIPSGAEGKTRSV